MGLRSGRVGVEVKSPSGASTLGGFAVCSNGPHEGQAVLAHLPVIACNMTCVGALGLGNEKKRDKRGCPGEEAAQV